MNTTSFLSIPICIGNLISINLILHVLVFQESNVFILRKTKMSCGPKFGKHWISYHSFLRVIKHNSIVNDLRYIAIKNRKLFNILISSISEIYCLLDLLPGVEVLVTQSCQLFVTPWTVARQAPPSMEFSRQEHWSGLPFPSPGHLSDPGIEPVSLIAGRFFTVWTRETWVTKDTLWKNYW